MIITIDGPAGAGKSSVARDLARRLGYRFLDTGAMYRAVAWAALTRQLDWDDSQALVQLVQDISLQVTDDEVLVDGQDVTDKIRTMEVTSVTRHVADNPAVRQQLVHLQRRLAAEAGSVVTEGRDQGTVAFPAAECKIFLDASSDERARRRLRDLQSQGEQLSYDEVLAHQNERDRRDQSRPVGRLVAAPDAVHVCTDGLTPQQVVDQLAQIVATKTPRTG